MQVQISPKPHFFYVSRTFAGKFKCEEKHKDKALSQILLSLTSSSLAGVHFWHPQSLLGQFKPCGCQKWFPARHNLKYILEKICSSVDFPNIFQKAEFKYNFHCKGLQCTLEVRNKQANKVRFAMNVFLFRMEGISSCFHVGVIKIEVTFA